MMFRKKKQSPPCHFRQFVQVKESWDDVIEHLGFRPKITRLELRRQVFEAEMEAAFRGCYRLLAVDLFEHIASCNPSIVKIVGEEPLMFECLIFASSSVANGVNPDDSEQHQTLLEVRGTVVTDFYLMSLLGEDDIENVFIGRCELYDQAVAARDPERFLVDSFARVLTYLKSGELNANVKIRYEDPPDLSIASHVQSFMPRIHRTLETMMRKIVKREIDEEDEFYT